MNNLIGQEVKNLIPDISIFITGGILQYIVIYCFIPILNRSGIMQLGSWMILSIPFIFLPIIVSGIFILKIEKKHPKTTERLRINKFSKKDWCWLLAGLIILVIGSIIAFQICTILNLNPNPSFARDVDPWIKEHTWMFGLWTVYWPINILGEEFIWRGIILPRMEAYIGKFAWLFNSFLWGIFHLAFGLGNLITLIPTLIIVPYIAQKTQNTWTAVILHATLSGPGFAVLAFGLLQ